MEPGKVIQQTNKYYYNQSGIRVREEMTGSVRKINKMWQPIAWQVPPIFKTVP
jgi:uncharacterized protein YecE (DUF72 family)